MAALDFAGMFDAYSATAEKVWKYDRNLSMGASEVFTCLRKGFFKKFGYEPDDTYEADWGAAKRGDVIENNVAVPAVEAILPEHSKLIYAGSDQETLKIGRLSATPDGLVTEADFDALAQLGIDDIITDCFVTEFKSFDPRASIKEEKAVHAGQVQVQMGLIHELTDYRPEYAVIIYFNASILSDIRPFVVKRDPAVYKAAKIRANQVFNAKQPTDLLPEGKLSGDCRLCEFTEECALAQGESTPREKRKVDPEVQERLRLLAERQKDADAAEKTAKQDKKVAEEEIKQLLRDNETKGAGDDAFSISLTWCAGKKSTDLLAMAADGIDIEAYQKEGSGYERLTVKLK
jgi:hypothetical protein